MGPGVGLSKHAPSLCSVEEDTRAPPQATGVPLEAGQTIETCFCPREQPAWWG